MRLNKLFLPLAALAATFSLPVLAADYDPPMVIDQAPEYVPVEVGSGWYLRGDVGYAFDVKDKGDYRYSAFDPVAGGFVGDDFDDVDLSKEFSFGVGAGYHFTDWLRADATVERLTLDFDGSRVLNCGGAPCVSDDSSSMVGYAAMINGYVDLGTVVGFTPYVGAGAGYTYVDWDDLDSDLPGASSQRGDSDWRFSYALMAGVAYDLTDNLKLDLGYKYRHIDGGKMFASSAANGAGAGSDGGFASHEVRLGLRYELW